MHAGRAALALVACGCLSGCQPTATAVHWTCDFDASESRPLSDPDAAIGADGALPESVCEDTCGTPALKCTYVALDGGEPGAICPVCTFQCEQSSECDATVTSQVAPRVMSCHAEMGMQDPVDDDFGLDLEPTSAVRAVSAPWRRLVVDTGLRGAEAESAWVTVTDQRGAVFYEGSPSADGCVDVSFEGAPDVRTARITLETARLHRTAEVELGEGWTSHAFTS